MRIAYRGNFGVPFSTENHVAASMESLGHRVVRLQEDAVPWDATVDACTAADVFWWTSTYGYARSWPEVEARAAVDKLNGMLPTVSHHLDLWAGLDREDQLATEPFFRTRWVFTADGDHQEVFAAHGIRHLWMPPAVLREECHPGTPRPRLRADVAFVGSWQGGYHGEWWPRRRAMLDRLRARYGRRFACWPRGRAVRGRELNDLYASVKVVVGDSCLADRVEWYFSDRPFETVGRGGFLVMPRIPALADMLTDGEHLAYHDPGDLDDLCRVVDHWLARPEERRRIAAAGQAHVRERHTYADRVSSILDILADAGDP